MAFRIANSSNTCVLSCLRAIQYVGIDIVWILNLLSIEIYIFTHMGFGGFTMYKIKCLATRMRTIHEAGVRKRGKCIDP